MQKSNEPDDLLLKINDITNKISSILVSTENFSKSDLSKIENYFSDRQVIFNQLDSWLKSDDGVEYLKNNSISFNNKLKNMIEIDEYNIKRIKNNLDGIKEKIRNLAKQKSVLKYNLI